MTEFIKVARTVEIAPGEAKVVETRGKRVAIFNIDGAFHAIDNTCTFRGGPLSEGMVAGYRSDLPVAWSRFCRHERSRTRSASRRCPL